MSLVKRPVVVGCHEGVSLLRKPDLERIVFNMFDRAPDVIPVIEKHLSTRSTPDRMIELTESILTKPRA